MPRRASAKSMRLRYTAGSLPVSQSLSVTANRALWHCSPYISIAILTLALQLLHSLVAGSRDNIQLLLAGQIDELNRIA